TTVSIFVEKSIQNGPRFLTIFCKNISFLNVVSAFAARQWRLVEDYVTNEIESVVVVPGLLRQLAKKHTFSCEFIQNGLLAISLIPLCEEGIKRVERFLDGFPSVILEGLGDQLTLCIQVLNSFSGNGDLHIVYIISRGFASNLWAVREN